MPDAPKTPHRTIRVDTPDWHDLSNQAKESNTNASEVIRAFIRWYLRRPGATLPHRPRR